MLPNALNLVIEVMPEKVLNYVPVTVITNLFVSNLTSQCILKKSKDIYHLGTGFTSEKHWFSTIQKAAYDICEVVMNEKFFDPVFFNYHFDYEDRLLALVEKFKNKFIFVFSFYALFKMY